ncbi:metallophosphoesterase family protein (plasmid) [Haladaptatus sp. SPP-AMP-3]|uniref:metallophosphoesterase family protein n=1 Tax=Haladaptatus sp. SPP-AMP-3 TaxID=3121295 RepID=UPI003C2DBBF2
MNSAPFNRSISAQHRAIDLADWNDVYVIGDVHGCRKTLDKLVGELAPSDDDLLVFVGDLVRRGPDSHGVVELVRSSDNMLSVRGNNEEKLLRGRRVTPDLTEADLRWLFSLPVVITWENALVVHGGIDPRKPLGEHTVDDLQNVESLGDDGRPFWWERYSGDDRVFFGHTVLERPVVEDAAVGLDTGCVYGGALTAYDVRRDRTIRVEPARTHKERPPEKFVRPLLATPK